MPLRNLRLKRKPMQNLTKYASKKFDNAAKEDQSEWYLINAENVRLGRLATFVSKLVMGKEDVGVTDYQIPTKRVVIINSDKLSVYPTKLLNKMYYNYSGFPSGLRKRTLADLMAKDSTEVIRRAISGMLPKNRLRDKFLSNLFIYTGEVYTQVSQQPKLLTVK